MSSRPLRVLVVDDSAIYRKAVRELLEKTPDVEVVGVAANGKIALQKIEQLKPDLLTLDIEMPEMDGIEVLKHLQQNKIDVAAIMLSAFTEEGAKRTTDAVNLGAFDFVLKPQGSNAQESIGKLRRELLPKIEAFRINYLLTHPTSSSSKLEFVDAPAERWSGPTELIVIGVSTGGPASLTKVLPRIPKNFGLPILIVQHMPPIFTKSLAEDLDKKCQLEVREAAAGDKVRPGQILIAPGGKQMKIEREDHGVFVRITDDPPERSCRPSADYLFRSAAEVYGGSVTAVIMTGMGDDGTEGCRLLKRRGAKVIAQDEASCVVYGMPRQVAEAGLADIVCTLTRIPDMIQRAETSGVTS